MQLHNLSDIININDDNDVILMKMIIIFTLPITIIIKIFTSVVIITYSTSTSSFFSDCQMVSSGH